MFVFYVELIITLKVIFFFTGLLVGNGISTSISPFQFRAGSPVVKAGNFYFFTGLLVGDGISTSISPFQFRAGSPVVKAGNFYRRGQSLNPPEIFKSLFFFIFF